MAAHSGILAWRIPWTEEPGGLQSMGSRRVRHNQAQGTSTGAKAMRLEILHLTKFQSQGGEPSPQWEIARVSSCRTAQHADCSCVCRVPKAFIRSS